MITLKQLTYALAVEKTLHFKKAAEACHISQSALSTALTELERQLGVQVFERDNKKVLVTPTGQEILDRARKIVLEVEELQHLGSSQKAPLSYPMSIGFIPTIAPYLLPKLLPQLNTQHPDFQLTVIEEQSHNLVDKVRRGEIDCAVLALPFPLEGLLSMDFWEEDFYWITHKDKTLAKRKEITSDEIDPDKLMLLQEGHCLKDHILETCKLSPQENKHSFSATSLNTLIEMAAGKLGSTLVPEIALSQLTENHSDLSILHLNEPSPHRRLAFIFRPNYARFSSIERLIKLCRESLGKKN